MFTLHFPSAGLEIGDLGLGAQTHKGSGPHSLDGDGNRTVPIHSGMVLRGPNVLSRTKYIRHEAHYYLIAVEVVFSNVSTQKDLREC